MSLRARLGLPWWRSGWESACQCRGQGFESWSGKIPHAAEQLGPWATTTEPARLDPVLRNKRGRDSERPAHRDEEWPPLAATRESPRRETKTQHSHKFKKKKKKFFFKKKKKKELGSFHLGHGEGSFHFTLNLLHCGFSRNIPFLYSSFLIQQFWISPLKKIYYRILKVVVTHAGRTCFLYLYDMHEEIPFSSATVTV